MEPSVNTKYGGSGSVSVVVMMLVALDGPVRLPSVVFLGELAGV
jgi:hypothetical protein